MLIVEVGGIILSDGIEVGLFIYYIEQKAYLKIQEARSSAASHTAFSDTSPLRELSTTALSHFRTIHGRSWRESDVYLDKSYYI